MNSKKIAIIALFLPLAGVTAYALGTVGLIGIFAYHLKSPAGWQVFLDLVVALLLICTWMVIDAKRTGRNVLPYVLLTLAAGSFGPMMYLLMASDSKPGTAIDG